jgi:hypothetical protein
MANNKLKGVGLLTAGLESGSVALYLPRCLENRPDGVAQNRGSHTERGEVKEISGPACPTGGNV